MTSVSELEILKLKDICLLRFTGKTIQSSMVLNVDVIKEICDNAQAIETKLEAVSEAKKPIIHPRSRKQNIPMNIKRQREEGEDVCGYLPMSQESARAEIKKKSNLL